MDMHRTALLRQPCHFHHTCAHAIDLSRLCQDRTDRHNPGATNACDHNVKGAVDIWQSRCWHPRQVKLSGLFFTDLCALQRYKRWAEAFDTAEIFVTGRLINCPFAPQLGFNRADGNTV